MGTNILNFYTPLILKNYLDNNIRLGRINECMECCIAMDTSSEPARLLTINVINNCVSRLIGTSNPNLPSQIDSLTSIWNVNKDNLVGKRSLLEMIELVSNSKKSDRILHLKYVYHTTITNADIVDNKNFDMVYNDTLLDTLELDNLWEDMLEKDHLTLKPLMDKFIYCIKNKDIRAYSLVHKIISLGKNKSRFGQRFKGWVYDNEKPLSGRFKAEYAIWEYLFKIISNYPNGEKLLTNLKVLFKWYYQKTDNIIYIIHAISYFIDDLDWDSHENVTSLDDDKITSYYTQVNYENFNISGNITKRDYLLYINDNTDDIIYNIFKESNRKGVVRKNIVISDNNEEELQEDPIHE